MDFRDENHQFVTLIIGERGRIRILDPITKSQGARVFIIDLECGYQLHPVVIPHVSHFIQVPFRTSEKCPHSLHISPS